MTAPRVKTHKPKKALRAGDVRNVPLTGSKFDAAAAYGRADFWARNPGSAYPSDKGSPQTKSKIQTEAPAQ